MNPYQNLDFFSFFLTLIQRTVSFVMGHPLTLASDELQILILFFISISTTLIGTFLVLKKRAMMANSISHTILLGIIIAYFFLVKGNAFALDASIYVFILGAIVTSFITTFLTELLSKKGAVHYDAANGFIFTFLLAFAVLLVS